MRYDPRRTSLDLYPLQRTITPLFGDTDALGHINNVSIARYFEQARVLVMEAVSSTLGGNHPFERAVLAKIEINFLAEVFYPHDIVIATGVHRIGTSSVVIGSALFQHGRCVALADSVDVGTAAEGGSRPVPEASRVAFEKFRLAYGD
ncbi:MULTISPECIES: acyl-CoA thioesterase [Rhodococcus]|uniref:Acyl-CoA thioesterase n=1 Tax=Rhodococcus rhodochrous TaxID=1829 RepID=A0AAW4X948_RHORH|nr:MULTISPECIES: acyl-CoA thioesterase [Rhodococcus]MCD2109633.1 acyl-CoA thioesterase [Rhodococcus rhodochrous]QHG83864.1 acyl-CoA thioesterase [Rhodococcus rhodochrous]QOH56453.1 acyl-CoA thioesterase [Rhodococcus rhodochrous]WAL48477.1 acyl-CoA thioesterase [Rhodococcus pyridinivorans]